MREHTPKEKFDFSPIGAAIKKARMERSISREELAEMCDVSPGYIKAIENTGKNPGFQLFWQLVTLFSISVDEYFYPDRVAETNSEIRNIIGMIRECEADDVYVLKATLSGLTRRRNKG